MQISAAPVKAELVPQPDSVFMPDGEGTVSPPDETAGKKSEAFWNKYYLNKQIPLFDEKEGKEPVGNVDRQILNVISQDGQWYKIDTWLGEKWINPDLAGAVLQKLDEGNMPLIFNDIPNRYFMVGGEIDYLSGVSLLYGNEDVKISYDSSKVDLTEPGRYSVYYTAKDKSGNIAETRSYICLTRTNIENVFDMADKILAGIIRPDMGVTDKAYAVYSWVNRKVTYSNPSPMIDPIHAANNAFTRAKGNCYTYYAASEVLLTRLGIPNIHVERVGGKTPHHWSFVNCGEGWYYFDATPYALRMNGFMFSDRVARSLKGTGGRDYTFERSLYTDLDLR